MSINSLLKIDNLAVSIGQRSLLSGLTLQLSAGETHALMGANGSGKSSLALTVMGHPDYLVTGGSLLFAGRSILKMTTDERAALGIFLSFQQPPALPGVTVSTMLKMAVNAQRAARKETPLETAEFLRQLRDALTRLQIERSFATRSVNDGFSGGERKRCEMLQALLLSPRLLILDEIDSGLDIDAIKVVAAAVAELKKRGATVLIITHYQRILDYVRPDFVHILHDGRIAKSGPAELVQELEASSFAAVTARS